MHAFNLFSINRLIINFITKILHRKINLLSNIYLLIGITDINLLFYFKYRAIYNVKMHRVRLYFMKVTKNIYCSIYLFHSG